MAQLKSTTVSGNLSVSGNLTPTATYSANITTSDSNYYMVGLNIKKFGNLVLGQISFSTNSGAPTITAWQWTTICPSGSWPAAFRPSTTTSLYLSMQSIGSASLQILTNGTVQICTYGNFGAPWASGTQVVYYAS